MGHIHDPCSQAIEFAFYVNWLLLLLPFYNAQSRLSLKHFNYTIWDPESKRAFGLGKVAHLPISTSISRSIPLSLPMAMPVSILMLALMPCALSMPMLVPRPVWMCIPRTYVHV